MPPEGPSRSLGAHSKVKTFLFFTLSIYAIPFGVKRISKSFLLFRRILPESVQLWQYDWNFSKSAPLGVLFPAASLSPPVGEIHDHQ